MTVFDAPAGLSLVFVPAALAAVQGLATLRLASHSVLTGPADTPANVRYENRVFGDIAIEQSVLDALTVGGRVALTASQIDLWNGDGALTPLIAEGRADGRVIVVRSAPVTSRSRSDWGVTYATAEVSWRGRASRIEDGGDRARVAMTDLTDRLTTALQTDKYDGSGGLSGTADLRGRPKPVAFGWRFNVSPVYVGQIDLGLGELPTYQTHSSPINGHDAVRIRGVSQAQVSGAPGIGQYADFPGLGVFQLGSTPDGAVTCDVDGDAACGLSPTLTAVLERILTGFGASLPLAEIDPTSWFEAGPALTGQIGWGAGAEDLSVIDALDQILGSQAAFLCGSRNGQLRLAALGSPAAQPHFTLSPHNCLSLEVGSPPASIQPAPQRVEIAARRNWTPLTEIAGSVSGADRTALAGPGAVESVLSDDIAAKSVRARTWSLPGLYRYPIDARARATALSAWLERGLRIVKVTTDRFLGRIELGLTGRVTYPLFGLQGGWTGIVVAYRESIGARRCEITMIG